LIKPDPQGTLILSGTSDYVGTTTVSGGSLLIDGVSGTNTITVSAGTLGGIGSIRGRVFVQSSGTLSPGDANSPGTLSISNALSLAGTNVMDIIKSGSTFIADQVTNITTLTLGCRLVINLSGDPIAATDSIKLYSFNSASGAVTGIDPASPGFGLLWDTSHLATDGTLRVKTVNTTPTNLTAVVVGNQLHLSWPADHLSWRLQAQTNALNVGLTPNWSDVPGSDAVTNVSFTIDPANGTVFFRMIYP
jgi:autotransporter-associated beta strand protein